MINRQKKYLREIIASYFGTTYDDLCALSEVSEKTLKADIRDIQSTLSRYGLSLCEQKNRIYIPFEQKEDFLNAYEEIIREDEKQLLANEYEERKIYILTYLCKSHSFISMNILADRLYVSKSSVAAIIHELKEEIPQLVPTASLTVSGRKGICLNAREKEMRELLVRFFARDGGVVTENRYFLNYLEEDLREKLSATLEITSQFLKEHAIVMANENISKLIAHIMIILHRVRYERTLDPKDIIDDELYFQLADKLAEIGLQIDAKELSSLPLHSLNRAIINNPIAIKVVHEFINDINQEFHAEILHIEDSQPLIAHIDELLKKTHRTTELKEFVFDTMLQRLLSAYFLCGRLCTLIKQSTGNDIDEENRAYMAMHVQDMYRKHLVIEENILLYDANISECNMIKTDLEKHFGKKALITPVYVRWDIEKKLKEKQYAIILSTQSILGLFDEVPFLKINSFLVNEDYDAINKIVYKNRPVKIIEGGTFTDHTFMYQGIATEITKEILQIHQVYVTCTINEQLKLGAYAVSYQDTRLFVLNNDLREDFMIYHRLINRFGQMLKEGKL